MKLISLLVSTIFSTVTLAKVPEFALDNQMVVLGSSDPDVISKVLSGSYNKFVGCYNVEIEKKVYEVLEGRIKAYFSINQDGKVVHVDLKADSKFSSEMKDCLSTAIRSLNFPKPIGEGLVEVIQPFNFHTKNIWRDSYQKEENISSKLVGNIYEIITGAIEDKDLGIYWLRIKDKNSIQETITCKVPPRSFQNGFIKIKILSKRTNDEGTALARFNCQEIQS